MNHSKPLTVHNAVKRLIRPNPRDRIQFFFRTTSTYITSYKHTDYRAHPRERRADALTQDSAACLSQRSKVKGLAALYSPLRVKTGSGPVTWPVSTEQLEVGHPADLAPGDCALGCLGDTCVTNVFRSILITNMHTGIHRLSTKHCSRDMSRSCT